MISERTSHIHVGLKTGTAAPIRSRLLVLTSMICGGAAVSALTLAPSLIAIAGAVAIGWSHLAGRCGASHFGTLTPRAKLPGRGASWGADVIVYTTAGAVSSTLIGSSLGAAGSVLPDRFRIPTIAAALLLSAIAVAIDTRLLRQRLPEPPWQTRREWGQAFRRPMPAALWGFCLGATVATVFTFSGVWVLLAVTFALGDPTLGGLLLLAHWFGRAIPVVAGPLLLDDPAKTLQVLDQIDDSRTLFRASSVVGIAMVALSLAILLTDLSL